MSREANQEFMDVFNNRISEERLKLSYHDRNAINEEIHGVRCLAVEETPELLRASLDAFQHKLDSLPSSDKEVYTEILRLKENEMMTDDCPTKNIIPDDTNSNGMLIEETNSSSWRGPPAPDWPPYTFVTNEGFRLRFLRCELFDVAKAVDRFVNYLKTSYELFGEIALKRLIRLGDFSPRELRLLRKGFAQIFPYRDRAGRIVMVVMRPLNIGSTAIEEARIFFYIRDAATRDSIESQRKGLVFIFDAVGWFRNNDASEILWGNQLFPDPGLFKKIIHSVPSRVVAGHTCWPRAPATAWLKLFEKLAQTAMGGNYAIRLIVHVGLQVELRYKLQGYGIPCQLLPLTETGIIKVKYFHEWLRIRKTLEDATEEEYAKNDGALYRVVLCPTLTDVVFRQGTPSMKNPGNVIFRDLMIAQLEEYYGKSIDENVQQQHPDQIEEFCAGLIETIEKKKRGRFLEWDKKLNVWLEMVDRTKIKTKVAIAYRDTTKRFLTSRKRSFQRINPGEGAFAFVEGGKYKNEFCMPSKRKRSTVHYIDGVPLRADSNYNESSTWY